MNTQKGFLGFGILIIVGLVLVGGGAYVYTNQKSDVGPKSDAVESTLTENEAAMEAKLNETKNTINDSVGKKLVTDATVKVDTKGNQMPALTLNPEVASELVAEEFGSNPEYVRQMIKARLQAIASGFQAEARYVRNQNDGSYAKVCDIANSHFTSEVNESLNSADEYDSSLITKLGITADSYRVKELTCKSNAGGYVATIPLTLEDGTGTTLCMSNSGSVFGKADYDAMACIKNN